MTLSALRLAAIGEAGIGVALLFAPSTVGHVLLGEQFSGSAIPVARVAGVALIGLAIACWPGPPALGMLVYSVMVAVYLAYLGLAGGVIGMLLWPAVALHLALSAFLAREVKRQ